MMWTARGWTGDLLDYQARERLMARRDVMWYGGEVCFSGIDREWLRNLGVLS